MRPMRWVAAALLAALVLSGCSETDKLNLSLTKYNPEKIYNAPFAKVYTAAVKAMEAEKYDLEVADPDLKKLTDQDVSGSLVTGWIYTTSPVYSYTDDKGEKKPCRVRYIMHADLRTQDDGKTMLNLVVPEHTEMHKEDVGVVWEKTDTQHWRGDKLKNDIQAILEGREPSPPGTGAPKAAGKDEKATGK